MKRWIVTAAVLLTALCKVDCALAGVGVLFYAGHSGLDQGHTQLAALYEGMGLTFDVSYAPTLPPLDDYHMIIISCPGYSDSTDFFSPAEVEILDDWLAGEPPLKRGGYAGASRPTSMFGAADAETVNIQYDRRMLAIGDWGVPVPPPQRDAVLVALLNDLDAGITPVPAQFDAGCNAYVCGAVNTDDILVDGLDGLCKSGTLVWEGGLPVSFPIEAPGEPWIVRSANPDKIVIGLGDSETLSDVCNHLSDPETMEFARRLYGELPPVPTVPVSWGRMRALYR